MTRLLALSVVAPSGKNIATGRKTVEVRSWQPQVELPLRGLAIVENQVYLSEAVPEDQDGVLVAIVDVVSVKPWQPQQVDPACATKWEPGYFAWELANVRPVSSSNPVAAKRGLYDISKLVDGVA